MKIKLNVINSMQGNSLDGNIIEIKDVNWVVDTSFEKGNYIFFFNSSGILNSPLYKFDSYSENA